MKHLRIYVACLSAVILAITTAITPAPASAAGETISLDSTTGIVNQVITISGSEFDPGTPDDRSVNIILCKAAGTTFDYSSTHKIVQVAPLTASGTFATSFVVPDYLDDGITLESVGVGNYYIAITYHIPPSTDGTDILAKTAFSVLSGSITLTPDTGPPGTEVTITGYDFGSQETLTILYDTELLTIFQGDKSTNINGTFANTKIFIPSSTAGIHTLTVKGQTSGHQAGKPFMVEPSLIIKPSPGTASSTITISGIGFGASANVDVTLNNITIFSGNTEINGSFSTSFPPNTFSEGTHIISAIDGNGNSAQASYNIFDASVTLEPSAGSPGWEMEISGAGFKPGKTITISFEGLSSESNITATTDGEGSFSTMTTVPWGTMGTWEVEVTDGDNTKTREFEVNTSSNIYPITNTSLPGNVGTPVAVAGAQFIAGRTVIVTWSGTQVATGTVESNGTFNVSFYAPSCSSGPHIIEASDGTNSIKYGFIMENSPPPKPQPLLPEPGTKAKAEAFFDWDDTDDASGVTYTLQIATDPSFAESYLILEEENITESEYTIPTQNRLNTVTAEAPYYWRVRAIDKAHNQGEWTDASMFYVGFGMNLPQSVIYVIIVGSALLLAAFTFWLGRKTAYY